MITMTIAIIRDHFSHFRVVSDYGMIWAFPGIIMKVVNGGREEEFQVESLTSFWWVKNGVRSNTPKSYKKPI